jgi:hypothetical protein
MSEAQTPAFTSSGVERRTVLKGAAWAVPVLAVAVAAPLASASVNNSSLAFSSSVTDLLTLNLLDGGGTVTAGALVTVPTAFTITNGAGAINQTATVTVTVARPSGINIPVGRARGFGVYSVNGATTTAGQRTAVYQTAPIVGQFGFPLTTYTGTLPVNIASNGTATVPIVFGLAGVSTGVAISALASFAVTLTVDFGGGVVRSTNSSITVPVGAGIL